MTGSVSAKIKTGGGFDSIGQPVPVSYTWNDPVECNYQANGLSNRGRYTDGTFKQSSFNITTNDMGFTATVVRLFDRSGRMVCEKEVISIEPLDEIQLLKIII